jgi:hypothetical protein
VYGKDEKNEYRKALLDSHPDILPFLLEIMDTIINYDLEREEVQQMIHKGFYYGFFKLSVVSVALRNLSISDENKRFMKKYPKLFQLAYQGIQLFIENASECKGMNEGRSFYDYGGGGGKDFMTVENLLELLLQLTFAFDDENELRAAFCEFPLYDVKSMMEALLGLPPERGFSFEGRQFVQQLLMRLYSRG